MKNVLLIFVLLFAGTAAECHAASTYSKANLKLLKDIETAQSDLGNKIGVIENKRSLIINRIETLKKELDYQQKLQAENKAVLNAVKSKVRAAEKLNSSAADIQNRLANLCTNYKNALETNITFSESEFYRAKLDAVALKHNSTVKGYLSDLQKLFDISREIDFYRIGGLSIPARASTSEGKVVDGRYYRFGSAEYFHSDSLAGIPVFDSTKLLPSIEAVSPKLQQQINTLATTNKASLPVYKNQQSLKASTQNQGLIDHIKRGGPVVIPIIILGILSIFVTVFKSIQLSNIGTSTWSKSVINIVTKLNSGDKESAEELAGKLQNPLRDAIIVGVRHTHVSKEYLEELMFEKIMTQLPKLERMVTILAVSAGSAPLLGLLGTVTGMIHTFNMISVYGSGNAQSLSGGISQALITTELGLIVAIPALLMNSFITGKIKKCVAATQTNSVIFVNALKIHDHSNKNKNEIAG